MNLEDALETQTILTKRKSLLSLPSHDSQSQELQPDSPSTPWSPISTDTNIDLSKFDFEDDLESSRVYRRAQRETMDFSFRSSIARSRSWSVFSGLSLSDVSVLSVIALPIHSDDITNAHHYHFGETAPMGLPQESNSTEATATSQDVPRLRREQPLLVECHDLKLKMLQLPGMGKYFDKVTSPSDPYHHLWDVVRQSSPLIILLQALDPRIEAPHHGHGWNRTDEWQGRRIDPASGIETTTKDKKRIILWFIQYCHSALNIPISSLFTISDLMYGDGYGFFKVSQRLRQTKIRNPCR
jgi:cell division control protein 24